MTQSGLNELITSKSLYRFPRAALAKMLGVKPWALNRLVSGGKPPRNMKEEDDDFVFAVNTGNLSLARWRTKPISP